MSRVKSELFIYIFFFKQKTAYEMRISDWSSDVCSSDLRRDSTVAVSVRDVGEGIPADDLPRVFTKFFRRDHGRPSGTGLGLWISRGLVEAHGGELTAS